MLVTCCWNNGLQHRLKNGYRNAVDATSK
jgi:hypothetical protein